MMIIGTCCNNGKVSLHKAHCLLQGYQQSITLHNNEVLALQAFTTYGAAATAFWRHQNFNYVNVDKAMENHYLAMKKLADQVMDMPNEEFMKSIGIQFT